MLLANDAFIEMRQQYGSEAAKQAISKYRRKVAAEARKATNEVDIDDEEDVEGIKEQKAKQFNSRIDRKFRAVGSRARKEAEQNFRRPKNPLVVVVRPTTLLRVSDRDVLTKTCAGYQPH